MYKTGMKVLIGVMFEFVTFGWEMHTYMDSFFFVWSMLYFGFFLMELFKVDTAKLSLIKYKPTNTDVKSLKSIIGNSHLIVEHSSVLAFLLMFILNLIGFLIYIRV